MCVLSLALGEVLQDDAQVPQAVPEPGEREHRGLVGWVQLEHRQQPPAPGGAVRGLLEGAQSQEEHTPVSVCLSVCVCV